MSDGGVLYRCTQHGSRLVTGSPAFRCCTPICTLAEYLGVPESIEREAHRKRAVDLLMSIVEKFRLAPLIPPADLERMRRG